MVVAILGDRRSTLPASWTKRLSLFSDREVEVSAGDGPELQIKACGLFSDVKVTDRPG